MKSVEIDAGALTELEAAIFARSGKVEGPSSEIRFCCPAHDDEHPSARYNREKGVWRCDACGAGGGFVDLSTRLGLSRYVPSSPTPHSQPVARYDYLDGDGQLLFQVLRYEPKSFRQRRPDGNGWVWNLDGVTRVLYQLPNVRAHASAGWRVYLVEGEKDADTLDGLGLLGTTSPQGAGKWKSEYADALTGAEVVIIPDRDEPGRRHALDIAGSCYGKATAVRILELPNAAAKDVTDWIELGGTAAELEALADSAPLWTPEPGPRAEPAALSISAAELIELDIPPAEWLIEGIWKAQAVGFIAGPPKAFKSFLALDLAFAVASGQDFLERFAPGERRTRNVMLIQNESAKGALRERVKAASERFRGVPPSLRFITNLPIVLEDEAWVLKIEAELEKFRPELLILDPLASLTTANENQAQDMGRIIRLLRGWRDRWGCAIATVHHTGKPSERVSSKRSGDKMRGSSALHGAVESALYVERADDALPRITVKIEQKESEPLRPFTCEFRSESRQLTVIGDVITITDEMIRDAVVKRPAGATLREILRDLPRTATEKCVRERLASMSGVRTEKPGGNQFTRYFVVADGAAT